MKKTAEEILSKYDHTAHFVSISDALKAMEEYASQQWVSVEEREKLPPENKTVWIMNEKTRWVAIGCRVYLKNEGWFWAVSNGNIYSENGQIVSECEIEDLDVTHFCDNLPTLPTPPKH